MRKYEFNNEIYQDIDSLVQAFINNFEAACERLFIKPKKFVSFVKSFDKAKAKKVVEIFETTKYKGNVLSFIIFLLSKDPIVLVNGINLDFNNFIKVVGLNRENKAINAFIEDGGISRTYATMDIDKKIPNDAYYIEKTFNDDFTYNYLANYLRIDYTENLNGFISNILINNDERFKRACEVVTSDNFQMVIAHKSNFKAAYTIRYSVNPVFDAIKMLSIEYNKADLSKIIDDTFYWWLLDNFDKYIYYKKEAVLLKNKLKKLKATSLKELTFDEHVELSRELYETYLLFADAFHKKEIGVNAKKFDVDQYTLDKPYCKTLICIDYMRKHPVTLTTAEELKVQELEKAAKAQEEAKAKGEELSDELKEKIEELDNSIEVEVIKDETPTQKEIKLSEKRTKRAKRMTKYIAVTTVLAAIIIALAYFALPLLPDKLLSFDVSKFKLVFENNKEFLTLLTYASLGVIVANLILMTVINIRNSLSQKAIDLFYKRESINKKETSLTTENKKALKYIDNNLEKIYKRIKRKERIITGLCLALAGLVYSTLAAIVIIIFKLNTMVGIHKEDGIKTNMIYISLAISFGVGLLWGLLFKKKGAFSAFVINGISIGVSIALLLFI